MRGNISDLKDLAASVEYSVYPYRVTIGEYVWAGSEIAEVIEECLVGSLGSFYKTRNIVGGLEGSVV